MSSSARGAIKGPVRIGAGYRRTVNVIALGVWATGVLWLVWHYFLRQSGEFGAEPGPLEPWWLRLHGAFAFGALWTLGLLSASHFATGWATRRRRLTGSILLSFGVILSLSGYLLYYVGAEIVRSAIAVLHWALGLAAPLAFVAHRYFSVRVRRGRALNRQSTPSIVTARQELAAAPSATEIGTERELNNEEQRNWIERDRAHSVRRRYGSGGDAMDRQHDVGQGEPSEQRRV